MKKSRTYINHLFELDDRIYRQDGPDLLAVENLDDLTGEKWLVTDFKEGMSRLMTVDGPSKYADMLVRRKLQESGEFEEPVEIITHWKRKRSRNSTSIFFTAVPTRLARVYLEDPPGEDGITLVFAMYGVLWQVAQRMAGKETVAVVLRHDRFAELVIASRKEVFFANRCVAFDTEPEQIHTLWQSVRSDISVVENEHRVKVARTICLGWIGACEPPDWPPEQMAGVVLLETPEVLIDGRMQAVSLPKAMDLQSALHSDSRFSEILCSYARKWAPAANVMMAVMLVCLLAGVAFCHYKAGDLKEELNSVRMELRRVSAETAKLPSVASGFPEQLKFIEEIDRQRKTVSYQQILNDLTARELPGLQVQTLTMAFTPGQIDISLLGDIEAPFDQAHGGYKRLLQRLENSGYRIEESRFETQISTSQVSLKLIRNAG